MSTQLTAANLVHCDTPLSTNTVDSCADAQYLVPPVLSLEEDQVNILSPRREGVNVELSVKGNTVWARNVKINPTVHAGNEYDGKETKDPKI